MSARAGNLPIPRRRGECGAQPARRAIPVLGRRLPDITLPYAPDGDFPLGAFAHSFSLVVCLFPAIGTDLASEADDERARAWMEHDRAVTASGHRLITISGDDPDCQHEWLEVEAPPYLVLCDRRLALARDLGLPTLLRDGRRVYEPTTLIVRRQRIVKVRRETGVEDAAETTGWLGGHEDC